ncbi:MAG TPA: hypothetical protein VHQ66_03045 [Myxococcota bacterium]|nr:hypothetical protein [Myxococcota bacterium]
MSDRPLFPPGEASSPQIEVASLAGLRRALEDPGYAAVCFVGPRGSARADLLHALGDAVRARCRLVYLRGTALPPGGFWMRMADALELNSGYDARRRVLGLAGHLSRSGQALLVVLDDAHALPADTLYAVLATARSQPGFLVVLAHGPGDRLAGPLPEDVALVLSEAAGPLPPAGADERPDATGAIDADAPEPRAEPDAAPHDEERYVEVEVEGTPAYATPAPDAHDAVADDADEPVADAVDDAERDADAWAASRERTHAASEVEDDELAASPDGERRPAWTDDENERAAPQEEAYESEALPGETPREAWRNVASPRIDEPGVGAEQDALPFAEPRADDAAPAAQQTRAPGTPKLPAAEVRAAAARARAAARVAAAVRAAESRSAGVDDVSRDEADAHEADDDAYAASAPAHPPRGPGDGHAGAGAQRAAAAPPAPPSTRSSVGRALPPEAPRPHHPAPARPPWEMPMDPAGRSHRRAARERRSERRRRALWGAGGLALGLLVASALQVGDWRPLARRVLDVAGGVATPRAPAPDAPSPAASERGATGDGAGLARRAPSPERAPNASARAGQAAPAPPTTVPAAPRAPGPDVAPGSDVAAAPSASEVAQPPPRARSGGDSASPDRRRDARERSGRRRASRRRARSGEPACSDAAARAGRRAPARVRPGP